MLSSQYLRVTKEALFDSGATENFIHSRIVEELQFVKKKLAKPRKVRNVDGTFNKMGDITHSVHLCVRHQSTTENHMFLVADITEDYLILGYPFFESANPQIDWTKGAILGEVKLNG